MILKLKLLSPAIFASLAQFLASKENTTEFLHTLHPDKEDRELWFTKSGPDNQTFASLIKFTPNDGAMSTYKGYQDVTLEVANEYVVDSNNTQDGRVFQAPRKYIHHLFDSLELYPEVSSSENVVKVY